jgi:putative ABC transport system permease protein
MGRALLIARLGLKDIRHHAGQSLLLLLAIAAGAAMLTLGLALGGTTDDPYARTRAATNGPDVVAEAAPPDAAGGAGAGQAQGRPGPGGGPGGQTNVADPSVLLPLAHASGVAAASGPFPMTWGLLRMPSGAGAALVVGRDAAASSVDQPQLLQGGWVRPGGAVLEASFAAAAGLRIGDALSLGGRSYVVVGTAVTAAIPTYPDGCHYLGCFLVGPIGDSNPGLIWVPAPDVQGIAAANNEPLFYLLNLKLGDPAHSLAFAESHGADAAATGTTLFSWQGIRDADADVVGTIQQVLFTGSALLDLLALLSVVVLVGARVAAQNRRVGLLKAVGATPEFVAAVLLFEHALVALCGAAVGLLIGWQAAPLINGPGAGLLGAASAASLTGSVVVIVVALALAVAMAATFVPAVVAARQSTVAALEDAARPPRRRETVVQATSQLPATLLVGVRLAVRRPRRLAVSALSVAVTTFGLVAVVIVNTTGWSLGPRVAQATVMVSVMLLILAAVNAIVIASATALESRRPAALLRALGATPAQVAVGLTLAQLGPALVGVLLGIPGPIALFLRGGRLSTVPPVIPLVAVAIVTLLAIGTLTAVATLAASRGPAADMLQADAG